MELFAKLFGSLLVFVYHCFDRIVIHGYLSGLSRPEQVVYFFRNVVGVPVVDKEALSQRTNHYQKWVEAFARNHQTPIEWAEKGVRKEDHVRRWLRAMERADRYGVYFIFKSLEQGPTFRCAVPKYPTQDPNHRILAAQRSRFTHYYFYIRDEALGSLAMRVASFFPFQTTYYLNGHGFIERELQRHQIDFRKNDNAFLAVDDLAQLQAAADRLSPKIIRQRLDYWTFLLGTEVLRQGTPTDEPAPLLCGCANRVLPELHLQASLPHSPDLRAQLRDRTLASDGPQDLGDLRPPHHQKAEGQAQHHPRTGRARPSCLPRLLETRFCQTVRKVLHLPAQ